MEEDVNVDVINNEIQILKGLERNAFRAFFL